MELYDSRTALLLSGDFLLPGRLIVSDTAKYLKSAQRVAAYLQNRAVAHVLGSHIELDATGRHYQDVEPLHHPNERALELTKADSMGLPAALDAFNGFYETHANYVITHPLHNLIAIAVAALGVLIALIWALWPLVRGLGARRRRAAVS